MVVAVIPGVPFHAADMSAATVRPPNSHHPQRGLHGRMALAYMPPSAAVVRELFAPAATPCCAVPWISTESAARWLRQLSSNPRGGRTVSVVERPRLRPRSDAG